MKSWIFSNLRSLRRSFLHFHFISEVHIWFISYIINTHFFHGNIWTYNWPASNVSGLIAQLVEHRIGNREVTGSNPVEVLFQASLRNCINCVHCDDHVFILNKAMFTPYRIVFRKTIGIVWTSIRYLTLHFRDRLGAAWLCYGNRAQITRADKGFNGLKVSGWIKVETFIRPANHLSDVWTGAISGMVSAPAQKLYGI